MKKIIGTLLVLIVVLAGCSSGAEVDAPCNSEDGTYDITLVTDSGGINDKSFNQGTWEGVEAYCTANEDISATYIETPDASQLETNLHTAAEQSEVVVAVGFNFATPVYNVAPDHEDTQFILVDAEPTDSDYVTHELPNVQSVLFNEEQAGYLVGYVAGKTTETNHIGFIGGQAIPTVSRFAYGYIQGAQQANPEIVIDIQYADSFDDQTKGQTMADTMYANGCDIIFTAAGGTNLGVINSAIQKTQSGEPVWVIGVDSDMYDTGIYTTPEGEEASVVLTSAMKNTGTGVQIVLEDYYTEGMQSGTELLGESEDGVGLPVENPNLDPALVEEAYTALTEQMITGVPQTVEEAEAVVTTATINGEIK